MEIDRYVGVDEAEILLVQFIDKITELAREDGSYIVAEMIPLIILDLMQVALYIQAGHLAVITKNEMIDLIKALPESKLLLNAQMPDGVPERLDVLIGAMSDGTLLRLNRLRDQWKIK